MQTIPIHPGINVSELCYGVMPWGSRVHGAEADALLNSFRDVGGNVVDTAHCYAFWTSAGAGASELALGDYLERNGGRDELIIATKGAHPAAPRYRTNDRYMTRERIKADLEDSLGRLRIDAIDLYWLHRDDLEVPVGEIIEWLNAEVRAGRIRCFGGSNWTANRLAQANEYARNHRLQGMVASQPCWNLGSRDPLTSRMRWVEDDDRAWHTESQLPVFPYSPTGHGYFATQGERGSEYQNATSAARLQRTQKLAKDLNASPNQIALAWLLHQPFPVIPILGSADPTHLHDALGCIDVRLTPQQTQWLEDGA